MSDNALLHVNPEVLTSWGLPVLSRSNTIAFAVTTKFNCRSLFLSGISWRSVAKQSSREFASIDPATRIQDAGFQVSWVSTKSSLNLRSHLHTFNVQRHHISARTHREFPAPAMNMWREGSRGHLKIFETQTSRVFFSDVTTPRHPIALRCKSRVALSAQMLVVAPRHRWILVQRKVCPCDYSILERRRRTFTSRHV